MKVKNLLRSLFATLCAAGLLASGTNPALAQIQVAKEAPVPAQPPMLVKPASDAKAGDKKADLSAKADSAKADSAKADSAKADNAKADEPIKPAAPKADPEEIKLYLIQGDIVSGKLSIKDIMVETRFGSLKIPISDIKSFTPGLDSNPTLGGKVKELIEKLGADDFAERKAAQDELTKMGAGVRGELQKHTKDENAERSRRVQAILEAIEGDTGEDENAAKSTWVHQDTIETADFTVTGHITPKSFDLLSSHGTLTVALSDIRKARRDVESKDEMRKTVMVDQSAIAYTNRPLKNSGIKVEKGDKITLVVEGTLTMTPWGNESVSTPEGDQNNFGACSFGGQALPGGCLFGRIGDGGTVFKVGSKYSTTAVQTGTLQFGIAMQPNYARGNYQFPGGYSVKVRIEPK